MIPTLSSSRPTRWFIGTPMLLYSASVPPIAIPSISRPAESTSMVAAAFARRTGLR